MRRIKKLLLDIYRVALCDGNLSRDELIVLNNFCYNNNITIDELTHISKFENDQKIELPEEEKEKEKYLFEIARIIVADAIIREEEIYLFDRIARSLKVKKEINVLRNEIFRIVIDEFIRDKENEVNRLKNKLGKEYNSMVKNRINEKTIPESQHKRIVEELIRGYKSGEYTHPYMQRYKGFIIGESSLNEDEIKQIIVDFFNERSITFLDKDIKLCIGDYDSIKQKYSRFKNSVINGEYYFLVYGPHPHSLKSKENMLSWESYLEKTNTFVKGNHKQKISEKTLIDSLEYFINNGILK